MEYLDVLNSDGTKTGKRATRADVHRHGLWHSCVHGWVINSRKELLFQLRRDDVESFPGKWDISFAGHIGAGETVKKTLVREASEELGLDIKAGDFDFLFTIKKELQELPCYMDRSINQVYLVHKEPCEIPTSEGNSEVADTCWVNSEDLLSFTNKLNVVPHPEEYQKLYSLLSNKKKPKQ